MGFFYRNNIFALCWGSFEDRRQHRGKKAFYSIVSSNIPFSFTAISWGLVFILHTANIHVRALFSHFGQGHCQQFIEERKSGFFFFCWVAVKSRYWLLCIPQVLLVPKSRLQDHLLGCFPWEGRRHPSLLAFFRKLSGVRISRQMYLFSTSFRSQLKSKTFLPFTKLENWIVLQKKSCFSSCFCFIIH